ncbi:TPA: SEC-C domain-containing protein [Clostridioides difficile]|nr:SEC-C domain-containing protein [Clostridioides difficile]HBF5318327.1 SEC-C domain-containing protein [Clostridioides difficile]
MLECFFNQTSLEEIFKIKVLLNEKKLKLEALNFTNPFKEYKQAEIYFDNVKHIAIDTQNEQLANATFISKLYFHLFCNLASYFALLKDKEYKQSWDKLQDCLDDIYGVGQFVELDKRFELPFLNKLLNEYQKLYPYKIFASSEYIITKSECSICGKSMNSLSCPHIKGNLYWGEVAYEKISEIKEINAVALVTNPVDKRCIMELVDDARTEVEKFVMLDSFLEQNVNNFQLFEIKDNKILKRDENIKKQGANELCMCGSGKKFKKCCKSKMYYEHHHFQILLKECCHFKYFDI